MSVGGGGIRKGVGGSSLASSAMTRSDALGRGVTGRPVTPFGSGGGAAASDNDEDSVRRDQDSGSERSDGSGSVSGDESGRGSAGPTLRAVGGSDEERRSERGGLSDDDSAYYVGGDGDIAEPDGYESVAEGGLTLPSAERKESAVAPLSRRAETELRKAKEDLEHRLRSAYRNIAYNNMYADNVDYGGAYDSPYSSKRVENLARIMRERGAQDIFTENPELSTEGRILRGREHARFFGVTVLRAPDTSDAEDRWAFLPVEVARTKALALCRSIAEGVLQEEYNAAGMGKSPTDFEIEEFAQVLADRSGTDPLDAGFNTRGSAAWGFGSNVAFMKLGYFLDLEDYERSVALKGPGDNMYTFEGAIVGRAPKKIEEMEEIKKAARAYIQFINAEGEPDKDYAIDTRRKAWIVNQAKELNKGLIATVKWFGNRSRLYGATAIRETYTRALAKTATFRALDDMGAEDRAVRGGVNTPVKLGGSTVLGYLRVPFRAHFLRRGKAGEGKSFNVHVDRDSGNNFDLDSGVDRFRVFAVNHKYEKMIRERVNALLAREYYGPEMDRISPTLTKIIQEAILQASKRGEISLVSTNYGDSPDDSVTADKIAARVAETISKRSNYIDENGMVSAAKYAAEVEKKHVLTVKRLEELPAMRAALEKRAKIAQSMVPALLSYIRDVPPKGLGLRTFDCDSRVRGYLAKSMFEHLTNNPKYQELEKALAVLQGEKVVAEEFIKTATETGHITAAKKQIKILNKKIAEASRSIAGYLNERINGHYIPNFAQKLIEQVGLSRGGRVRSHAEGRLRTPTFWAYETADIDYAGIAVIARAAAVPGAPQTKIVCPGGIKLAVERANELFAVANGGKKLSEGLKAQLARDLAVQLAPMFKERRIIGVEHLANIVKKQLEIALNDRAATRKADGTFEYDAESLRYKANGVEGSSGRVYQSKTGGGGPRAHAAVLISDMEWFRTNVAQKLDIDQVRGDGTNTGVTVKAAVNNIFNQAKGAYRVSATFEKEVKAHLEKAILEHGEIVLTTNKIHEIAEGLAAVFAYAQLQESNLTARWASHTSELNRTSMGHGHNPKRYDYFMAAIDAVGACDYEKAYTHMNELSNSKIVGDKVAIPPLSSANSPKWPKKTVTAVPSATVASRSSRSVSAGRPSAGGLSVASVSVGGGRRRSAESFVSALDDDEDISAGIVDTSSRNISGIGSGSRSRAGASRDTEGGTGLGGAASPRSGPGWPTGVATAARDVVAKGSARGGGSHALGVSRRRGSGSVRSRGSK